MKLYWFQVAPNPTKVRLYVAEKNAHGGAIVLDGVVLKLPKGEQHSAEHRARNPFGAVPVLEFDDGGTLTESLAIIEYLEELHPQPSMWGENARERARSRELERIADLRVLLPIARYIHATNSPTGRPPNPGVAEQAQTAWPAALAYFDQILADGQPFLAGAMPTVADCTLAAALQFARFAKLEVLGAYPQLMRWDAAYRAREPARAVLTL